MSGMKTPPKLELRGVLADAAGAVQWRGWLDITDQACRLVATDPGAAWRWATHDSPGLPRDFISCFQPDLRAPAIKGRLTIEGWQAAFVSFMAAVGGPEGMRELYAYGVRVATAKRDLQDAEDELQKVKQAEFVADWGGMHAFHAPHARGGFVTKPSDALASSQVDEPPPFVYGTRAIRWQGVDPADIRSEATMRAALGGSIDCRVLVQCALMDHHDEAQAQVRDLDVLQSLVDRWMPVAGAGNDADRLLEAGIASWNKRQDVVSHEPLDSVIVPAMRGTAKADAVRWCERQVRLARKNLKSAEDSWSPTPGKPKQARGRNVRPAETEVPAMEQPASVQRELA
jgi:hypothetical protein